MRAEHRSFTVPSTQGVDLVAHDLGGTGAPIILAHATGLHGMVWKPLAERLSRHYRCVAFDFRAHGRSTLPEGADLRWTSLADDLLAVAQAVSPNDPVRAVGHSMGGGAIALAAARCPERFESAWSFEPILLAASDELRDPPIAQAAQHRRRSFPDRAAARRSYASRPPLNALDPDALDWYVDYGFVDEPDGTVRLACEPIHEAMVFRNAASGADVAAVTSGLPFAVAVGNDGGPPAETGREVVATADNLVLIELELDHFGPLVDPDSVAASILAWF